MTALWGVVSILVALEFLNIAAYTGTIAMLGIIAVPVGLGLIVQAVSWPSGAGAR